MKSSLEETLAFQIRACGLPAPVREYVFLPRRRFRADFAWPEAKLLVECEGGSWTHGRHVRGKGFQDDCRKYTLAAIHGWQVLRYTGKEIISGLAITEIELVLNRAQDRDKEN